MAASAGERRWFRIDLGYDGTDFAGSQVQPGARTVQGELEAAIRRLTGEPVRLSFAGRTDRGVHALGQVAAGELRWDRTAAELLGGLRAFTPDDIAIYGVAEVSPEFHPRYDARAREYRYRVWNGPVPPLLLRRYSWHVRQPLDAGAMQQAAVALLGEQDFAALAGSGRGVPWSEAECTRTVFAAAWSRLEQPLEPADGVELLEFRVSASGFLPQMVRNIVGDLVAIGRGVREPGWLSELLGSRDRRLGEPPAPPAGLVLWRVVYT